MGIMIFFLVLSALVGVGTWWYVKYNSPQAKNKRRAIEKGKSGGNNSDREENKISPQQMKEIKAMWGIEDIRNGIIELKDNRYRVIVSLGSLDFGLLSEAEQTVIENQLMQAALSFQFPVKFYTTTEKIDTSSTVEEINKTLQNDEYPDKLINYASKMKVYLNEMMENRGTYAKKSYAVIFSDLIFDKDKVESEIFRRAQIFMSSMTRAKIFVNLLGTAEIIDLLHRELNKESPIKPSDVIRNGGMELYMTGLGVLGDVDMAEVG